MQARSTIFRMCINVTHVRVVYMQVRRTIFRMFITVTHVRVVYVQVRRTIFRMPIYIMMNGYLLVSAFLNLFI